MCRSWLTMCMLCSHGATVTCRQRGQSHVRICVTCWKKGQLNCCNGGRRKEIKVKEDKKERMAMIDEDKNLMILRFIPAGLFQQFNLTNNGESLHDSCSRHVIYSVSHSLPKPAFL